MTTPKGCNWPESHCECYAKNALKPDSSERIWMHCLEGLSLTKASMTKFVMFCLLNNIEIGQIHPFNYKHKGSQVSASVRLRPDQVAVFEIETGGKLSKPPKLSFDSHSPEFLDDDL